ncbi:serine/threonine protein kinase [Piscinibacter sp. XHJ-5]|uniref:serine/threonine protein kinase n=1 Tax=Piscinibacter sp. XHJ-5 TaxID=3037797 RepID=UPI0024530E91|nr:serine/threonine protein kinase [Piscinibacter sp. XHJ-5]
MAAVPSAAPVPARIGRFELRRVLGKGAQATVWLGFDTRLEREVAVKLMRPAGGADAATVNHWLQEARSVSRLTHPHIVPVFEADTHEGQPYLVFEYVPGRTLSEHLRARGALPAREAVQLLLGVLEALQEAHAAGVVHRDLKPSNILVDGSGRARVMDFGIAAQVKDAAQHQQVVGTPGYMSPEAANGAPPAPAMDVFSTGLVLAEALHGKPLIAEKDPYRAIYRTAHEDLALPAALPAEVDDALRAIVLRALARDPAARHVSAAKFQHALQDWLSPVTAAAATAASVGNSGTLEFLLRRMKHRSDFPSMSDSVGRIQRVANSENESLGSLSNEILKDVALTNKLLRMVNSASYRHAGGGTISTVSRAVALVGFAGIRNMALSLVLLEHMHDKGHATQLKEEFLRSLMAGTLAGELCPVPRESEEAFIGAMFQNLGRLLTEFYFPEEARQIRGVLTDHAKSGRPVTVAVEEAASIGVLGVGFEDLGSGVARTWGLPETLQRCMRRPTGDLPSRVGDKPGERLRWLALAANEITDVLLRSELGESAAGLAAIGERYGRLLGVDARELERAAGVARSKLSEMTKAMNLHVAPGTPASRLLREPAPAESPPPERDTLTPHELHATLPQPLEPRPVDNAAQVMAAGIQDITNSMVESFRLNEVLRMILETMFRALGFRRIVFCLRDAKTDTLTGRFGLGEGAERVAAAFKVPLKSPSDLFAAVCIKGADTLISDATAAGIASRLPTWYREAVGAPAFLLLPLMLKGAPFALIYADKAQPGGIDLGEKELSLLRTLRNQAVMAFKQAG